MTTSEEKQAIRLSILEHTVLTQNSSMNEKLTSTNEKLDSIARTIREVHDKIDNHMLSQENRMTRVEERNANNMNEIKKTNTRINKTWASIMSIATALVGSLVSFLVGAFNK